MAERKRMTTRFKELFEQKQFFVMAGGMNPIGARMAEVLGYEVFYMSGGTPRHTSWAGPTRAAACGIWWTTPARSC